MQPKQAGGNNTISWQAPEYVAHHHSAGWYLILTLGTAALAAITYLLTSDIFGVVTISLLGVIVGIAAARKPKLANYTLTSSALSIDDKQYSLRLFKSFTTASEGELDSATLQPLKRFMLPVAIYFTPDESHQVLDALVELLPHDEKGADPVDRLARHLRF